MGDPPESTEPVPDAGFAKPTGRYKLRFGLLYGGLAAVFIAAVVGLAAELTKSSSSTQVSAKGWSDWRPDSGTTGQMATQIAQHVARQYKLNKAGAPLLAVVAGPPQVTSGTHNIAVSNIAVKKAAASAAGIEIVPSGSTWKEQLCGIGGSGCSIPTGKPSETRGRLVRREALEVALYTFKFVPTIKSIVAFMPPPAGQPPSTLLYLQRDNFKKELDQPLRKTLPLDEAAAADRPGHQGGGDDRPSHTPGGLLVQLPAAAGRERAAGARPLPDLELLNRYRVARDEREDAVPRVLRGVGELLVLAVEEAVRSAVVGDQLVLHPGGGERLVEGRGCPRR